LRERVGIAGSGVIACGLAVAAAESDEVLLWARSDDSAERARARVVKTCSKLEGYNPDRIRIVTDLDELANATFLVEAVVEHHGSKTAVLGDLGELARHAGARDLCAALGKTPVEVPDIPGFVVNRLLFPYLFSAVELLVETGMSPEAIDECMTLGAGMPMGPIALLDYVGLDVSQAIGESIGVPVPPRLIELVHAGALGRKTGRGFYSYE